MSDSDNIALNQYREEAVIFKKLNPSNKTDSKYFWKTVFLGF